MGRGLSSKQLQENFADITPPLTHDQALVEAARCLYCFDAPCMRSCPTRIDVPTFIRQILQRNPIGAANTILDANIFGGSCARACPTEVLCEGACVDHTLMKSPVQIGRLQRYACDYAREKDIQFYEPGAATGHRVAIIGAGPAGLTCAHELRKQGHEVTVFEAREMPGGINTYGIARYKYDTKFALSEVEQIKALGMEIRCQTPVSGQQIAAMLKEYDAVFLGIGLGPTSPLKIPGEDLPGVWDALDFVFQTHLHPLERCEVGREVIVIGAGNTAIDVATAAVRLGAERVTIVYRRTVDAMPAFHYEFELARRDGIRFEWLAEPVRILAKDGRAGGVEFIRTQSVGEGRQAQLDRVPGSEFTIAGDMIVIALGQETLVELVAAIPALRCEQGGIVVDKASGATSVPGLFAGGDCISRGAEVVNAVQEGKIAAAGIHRLLLKTS